MLDVYMEKKRFYVALDPQHSYFSTVFPVVKSLLTTVELSRGNVFSIGYEDVTFLKDKLRKLNLLPYCTISDGAYNFLDWLDGKHVKNESVKKGIYNDTIKLLLKDKLKTIPYEDQYSAISYIVNNPRAGLFDDMGSGKSLISLASIVALGNEVKRTLVICPNNVVFGYMREIEKHTYLKGVAVPSGTKKSLEFLKDTCESPWDIQLIHPENLINRKGKRVDGDNTNFLITRPWDMIIVDEWHMYKNVNKKRSACVFKILKEARNSEGKYPRLLIMTGTPVSESPVNSYSVLKALGFDFLYNPFVFENYFCRKEEVEIWTKDRKGNAIKRRIEKVAGYRHLDELKTRIEHVSIRRTKDEMKGFPDKTSSIRDVVLKGKQLKLYKSLCDRFISEIPKGAKINLRNFLKKNATALKLRQLLNHPNLIESEGNSVKYEEIDKILEELFVDPEQKVVIWTAFRKSVKNIYDLFNKKYGAVKIYGDSPRDEMSRVAPIFENEDYPRIAVCTAEKAGTGTDFLARARTAIYVDRPYSFTLYKQSMDRIHRRVKTVGNLSKLDRIRSQPASLIFLDAVGTIDVLIRDILLGKTDMSDAITTSDEKLIEIGRKDLIDYLKMAS